MTDIKRGITIEGQNALNKFGDQMLDDIDRVMNIITNSIIDSTWEIKDMDHHNFYLRAKLYNNVVENVLTPIINNYESEEIKNDKQK